MATQAALEPFDARLACVKEPPLSVGMQSTALVARGGQSDEISPLLKSGGKDPNARRSSHASSDLRHSPVVVSAKEAGDLYMVGARGNSRLALEEVRSFIKAPYI